MPTLILSFADLPNELRHLPHRDRLAIMKAIRTTMEVDAHRWIQWSIAGGGWEGQKDPDLNRRVATEEEKRTRKRTPQKRGLPGLAARLAAKLRKKPATPPKKEKKEKSKSPRVGYRAPVDTGDYKSSWRSEMDDKGNALIYSSSSPPIKAGVIEEGRRPKAIPIEPLARWVERKLGLQGDEARGVAWGISRKAAKQAREGLHVLTRAHPKIVESLVRNVARELKSQPLPYGRLRSSVKKK